MVAKLLFLINLGLVCCAIDPPKFSSSYIVKGSLYIPFAEIKEPFYAWYDVSEGKSRIDYYGGMVKTYQLSKNGTHGLSLKIAPMTTDTELNKISCFNAYGEPDSKIEPQSVLPNVSEFNYIGEELFNGVNLEKWRLVTSEGEKVNKYTLWVRYTKVPSSEPDRQAIPVRYEMKGYNSLLGSHYDHYFLDYEVYSPEKPEANIFEIEPNMTCSGFPGPGDQYIVTFNPMREFINNERLHHDAEFTRFKHEHKKAYYNEKDHSARKTVFTQNLRFIHSKNRAGLSYKLGVNHLADRSDTELKALRGNRPTGGYNGGKTFPYVNINKADYPETLDWTLYGAVTPVKDQSVCGSCWSFGTTGTLEGAYFMKYKKQAILSQQALIDCSWGYGNNGCDGGEDFRSYQWILKHGGLPTEDDYGPYLGQDGYCHIQNTTITAPITGFVNVTPNSEDALKLALAKHGPISVAIDASQKSFSFYSNGVYYDENCKNSPNGLDHAVLAVGYGKLENKPYWMVKNSWSTYWGNQGYVLMSIKDNNCGVMTDPTYVTM
uniref:Counting factor associated protein D n=1 Tax=Cacopsylla melanoneura TaxID=428564 RepID=A0A8D8U3N5_9HEMI